MYREPQESKNKKHGEIRIQQEVDAILEQNASLHEEKIAQKKEKTEGVKKKESVPKQEKAPAEPKKKEFPKREFQKKNFTALRSGLTIRMYYMEGILRMRQFRFPMWSERWERLRSAERF